MLRVGGGAALGYGPIAGSPELRETVCERMRARGSEASVERTVITNGAQQAIELVLRTFVERSFAAYEILDPQKVECERLQQWANNPAVTDLLLRTAAG